MVWTISKFLFVKQYKVVNYVLFLSDSPIGKKEKPIYNERPSGNMIFLGWKYLFAQMEI